MKADTICCSCISKYMTKEALQNHYMYISRVRLTGMWGVRWVYFQEKYHNSRKYTHPPLWGATWVYHPWTHFERLWYVGQQGDFNWHFAHVWTVDTSWHSFPFDQVSGNEVSTFFATAVGATVVVAVLVKTTAKKCKLDTWLAVFHTGSSTAFVTWLPMSIYNYNL